MAAQARLPVTVPEEMLGSFIPGAAPEAIRQRLAERIGDYGAGVDDLREYALEGLRRGGQRRRSPPDAAAP